MATLGETMAAIADDLDDTTGEYTSQIRSAILGAIRWGERTLYYFNQTRDVTFPTVQGQAWYDAADNAQIPTLVRVEFAYVIDAGGQLTDLKRVTQEEIEVLAGTPVNPSRPISYAYFARKLRLYPAPDAGPYTIRLQLSPYRLNVLAADSDTNAWLSEAYDMIKARAKYIVYKDTIKDPALAAEALNDYQDQHNALKKETAARMGRRRVTPTCF